MATTITQAVLAKFASAGLTDFDAGGGLWLDMIPEGKSLPFICFTQAEETTEYTTELEYFEQGGFDFYVFAITPAAAESKAMTVKAAFDVCIKTPSLLTITNAKVIQWERTGGKIQIAEFPDQQQRQVGLATFSYRYQVMRTLPT